MPTGVKMYVRLKGLPSEEIAILRNEFMQAMALTSDDFYVSGPLTVVTRDNYKYMPVKDKSSVWLDVNLWKSYYGPGYERGDPELFVKSAEWLEQRLLGAEIYYGHDVNDENVSLFDNSARDKLLELNRKQGSN